MTPHLLRLLWNRRRTNLLVGTEIFFSFLVLLAVVVMGVHAADNDRRPLGFTFDRVWNVDVSRAEGERWDAASAERYRQVLLAMASLPEVEAVAPVFPSPWAGSMYANSWRSRGRQVRYRMAVASDAYASLVGLTVVKGRWFSAEDDGALHEPIVVSESLALGVFGTTDVLGRGLGGDPEPGAPAPAREQRVVGVVADYRTDGEYAAAVPFLFERATVNDATAAPAQVVLKVRPGTSAEFEETLARRLHAAAGGWSFRVDPLERLRRAANRSRLTPLLAAGIVAGFMILMVALGLSGVLWQSVTQRTREIGLRRATGATGRQVHLQILAEVALLTLAAVAAGIALAVQLPLLELLGDITPAVFATSLAVSAVAMLAITSACAFYPSLLATRVSPAEALRYE